MAVTMKAPQQIADVDGIPVQVGMTFKTRGETVYRRAYIGPDRQHEFGHYELQHLRSFRTAGQAAAFAQQLYRAADELERAEVQASAQGGG